MSRSYPKNLPKKELRSDRLDDYFNYALRDARISKGCTSAQLAEAAGVEKVTICAYERLRAFPSQPIAVRIADFLGKSVEDLFSNKVREITREVYNERKPVSYNFVSKSIDEISLNQLPVYVEEEKIDFIAPLYDAMKSALLSIDQKKLLSQLYYEGKSAKEISEELGLSYDTVLHRKQKVLDILRREYWRRFDD